MRESSCSFLEDVGSLAECSTEGCCGCWQWDMFVGGGDGNDDSEEEVSETSLSSRVSYLQLYLLGCSS